MVYYRVSGHSLFEVDRRNLVGKVKAQSPARYNRRLNYKPIPKESDIDIDRFIDNDLCIIYVPVGDYVCTIAFNGIIHKLIKLVDSKRTKNFNLQTVIKAVTSAIDNTDLYINCTCADFKYRYAAWATKYNYKFGRPETRPPKITNPDDKIGSMCKHLTSILANKTWLIKLSSIINNLIKQNYDRIIDVYKLDPEEFFSNDSRRPSNKTGRNTKMLKVVDDEDSADIE